MTYEPARPRHTLPFNGNNYDLLGDLALVEAIEYAFQEGIMQIATRVTEMGVTDTAKLLSVVISSTGQKLTPKQAGEAIFGMGINSEAFTLSKLHLFAFLRIMLEPPEMREKVATKMGEMLGELTASPGENTNESATAT